jgi:hypothetical protein
MAGPANLAPAKEDRGRPLTPSEIKFARKIFDNDLDYSRPRVFNSEWAIFQPDNRAMAPNGNIYLPGDRYRDDFSKYTGDLVLLLHELTHVWQFQHGMWVKLRRVLYSSYRYGPITGSENFYDYGIEQQAAIVEDYARLLLHMPQMEGTGTFAAYRRVIPFLPKPKKAPPPKRAKHS